jgi:hypothetical protein
MSTLMIPLHMLFLYLLFIYFYVLEVVIGVYCLIVFVTRMSVVVVEGRTKLKTYTIYGTHFITLEIYEKANHSHRNDSDLALLLCSY